MKKWGLPPILEILLELRIHLQAGYSLAASLESLLRKRSDPFSQSLKTCLIRIQAGQSFKSVVAALPELSQSRIRHSFVVILEKGLSGGPIDPVLRDFQDEIFQSVENSYERHLQLLPFKLLVPLMLFVFPAVMLLVLGPVVWSLEF